MGSSDYLKAKQVNWFRGTAFPAAPTQLYWSLHSDEPDDTGSNEITSQLTGRAAYDPADFTAAATVSGYREKRNTAIIDWGTATGTNTATHWGLWDALTTGNFLFSYRLEDVNGATPFTFNNGDPVTLGIDAVGISFSLESWSVWMADQTLAWITGTAHPTPLSNTYLGLHNTLDSTGTGDEVTTSVAIARLAIASAAWAAITEVNSITQTLHTNAINFGNCLANDDPITKLSLWSASTSGNLLVYPSLKFPQSVRLGKPIYIPPASLKIAAT